MPAVASAYDTRPWRTSTLVALAVLLAAHAALIVLAVSRLLPESPYSAVDGVKLRQVATSAALVLGVLVLLDRRRPAQAVAIAVLILAAALFLPGTVLTIAWLLVDAWLLGDALLRRVQPATSDAAKPDAALATLAGLALIVGALSFSAQWRIHYAALYATLLAVPVLFALRALPRYVERARTLLREPIPSSLAERAWLALLGVVLVLHVFTAAKPAVGFDAHTMHLQFARLVAASHVWRYDVSRYAWAVMPLGADWMFAAAYVLGGEACVRLLNAVFGILAGWLVYRLARASAPRLPALVSVTLLASAPLGFLVTGLLYSETLWCAFVIGTLVAALDWLKTRSQATLCALCLLAAGALQAKAISILWIVPLAAALMLASRGSVLQLPGARARLVASLSLLIGAWPYANAWWRTGNPVFPFMNAVFRSPLFDTARSFDNPLYHDPLLPWTPYQLVLDSGRFIEGATGAPGFHWLLLFPVIAIAFALRRRPRLQWLCVAIAAAFFVAVYMQQAYLRYLLPALLVSAAAAAWALADLPDGRAARAIVAAAGVMLVALNLRFMNTASWTNAELCPTCAFDTQARDRYVARYAPLAIVSEWLNENLPDARVGFFTLQDPSPAGYTGYSRSFNWHDAAVSAAFARARDADDILAIARAWKLTHVVVHVVPVRYEQAVADFRDRYTRPVWQFQNYRVAAIVAPSEAPSDTVSAR